MFLEVRILRNFRFRKKQGNHIRYVLVILCVRFFCMAFPVKVLEIRFQEVGSRHSILGR